MSGSADPARAPFPQGGATWPEIEARLGKLAEDDLDWRGGRVPLFVFRNDAATEEIGRRAFMACFSENALGRTRAFHSIGRMEREVLDWGLDLLSAPQGAAGAFTTGGSESLFLAMKAARDAHRARHGRRAGPLNIVMPVTGHPGIDKAADAMDLEIRRVPLTCDMRGDVAAMAARIDADTMALVGSAPCYPHGVIDPVAEMAALAEERGVWLHVDACVGGWIAPHLAAIGRGTPAFDFRFAGVRSISADLHKFGFCPKPASTVFYRDAADLDRAMFRADAWPSGAFSTPTLAGTRPGGAVAGAWAVLSHLGHRGFRDAARRLAEVVDGYVAGLQAIPGIEPWALPDVTIVNFGSHAVDMGAVAEGMRARGWLPGMTRQPMGLHLMLSMLHAPARDAYLNDLEDSMTDTRRSGAGASGDIRYA